MPFCVSSDFRTRTLRRHLDATVTAALASENAGVRRTTTGDLPAVSAAVAKLRPRPARILDGE